MDGVCPESFVNVWYMATAGPQGAWEYVISYFDTDPMDSLIQYNEYKSLWTDIVSWYPPCMEGEGEGAMALS